MAGWQPGDFTTLALSRLEQMACHAMQGPICLRQGGFLPRANLPCVAGRFTYTGRAMLLFLKLTITPVLVAVMSLVARRWGPTVGGLIMGLPWMSGPILFFLGLERGEAYAARASAGILAGGIGIGAYIIAYVYTARRVPWPVSLAAAFPAFAVTGYAVSHLDISLWQAAVGATASLCVAYLVIPNVADPGGLRFLPWWDIPMRMAATAIVVAVITVSADFLGPELSGVVAAYPVILCVIGVFTHSQWGWPAVVQLFRGVSLSLLSFVAFFLVVGLSVVRLGLIPAFGLAIVTALAVSAVLVLPASRRRRARQGKAKALR